MVKSRSNPCRPHLVQVLKTGKAVCDENCLMWTSLKICSHCIAVVHCLDCASEYISWFIANSKVNLTKITMSGIGPNVGKKPSQNCYSQRKSKAPILKRVPHSSFASSEQPGFQKCLSMRVHHLFKSHILQQLPLMEYLVTLTSSQAFILIGAVILTIHHSTLRCHTLC